MQKLLFLLLFPFVSFSQTDKIDSLKQIVFEYPVSELITEELKKRFIYTSSTLSTEVARFYDRQYQEYIFQEDKTPINESFQIWIKTDSAIFYKLKAYIELYGFPNNRFETRHILYVFNKGYTSEMIEIKKQFFPLVYKEYQNGLLTIDSIWWYLYKLGKQTLGNKFKVNENLNNHEQVEDMMIQLGLLLQ